MGWFKSKLKTADVQARYEHIQTVLEQNGKSGCLFLSLLSVAEEVTGKSIDLIDAIRDAQEQGWLGKDFTCNNQLAMLNRWTKKKWTRTVIDYNDFDPRAVRANDYTIMRYKRNKATHFRRRGWDVYKDSITVREGQCDAIYLYTWS